MEQESGVEVIPKLGTPAAAAGENEVPSEVEASAEDMLVAGEVVHDRYRIERLIGKGGMGEVYEASDLEAERRVALKTVLAERVGSDKIVARFYQEYELSRRITHDNVMKIYEVFEVERPQLELPIPCMAMELLDGETLLDRLQRDKRLSTDVALPIVCQMASALAASHRAQVVHRDLKPDNVFLLPRPDGGIRAVLTDFGVARRARPRNNATFEKTDSLTATNVVLGTPLYMAPEQLELEVATPATDIYTFGLVIYEMITGTLPFLALTPTFLQAVFARVRLEPDSPREHVPDLDPTWEVTILRCLERDPGRRFDDPDEVCAVLQGRTAVSTPAERDPEKPERIPTLWLVATFVAVALIALLLVWLSGGF